MPARVDFIVVGEFMRQANLVMGEIQHSPKGLSIWKAQDSWHLVQILICWLFCFRIVFDCFCLVNSTRLALWLALKSSLQIFAQHSIYASAYVMLNPRLERLIKSALNLSSSWKRHKHVVLQFPLLQLIRTYVSWRPCVCFNSYY